MYQKLLVGLAGVALWANASALPPGVQKQLLYSCSFDSQADLSGWVMEGPGLATVENGKLLVCSRYQSRLADYLQQKAGASTDPDVKDYEEKLIELVRQDEPAALAGYYATGQDAGFRGGPFHLWNRLPAPANYQLEFEFTPLAPYPLHMICFGAAWKDGRSIFDPALPPRNGVAGQYMQSDMCNYRISFFAGQRGLANMRRSPGRVMVAQGPDLAALKPDTVHTFRVVKWQQTVEFYTDDQLIFTFKDDAPLNGGQWGLRLMALARAYYDDFKLYELKAAPGTATP